MALCGVESPAEWSPDGLGGFLGAGREGKTQTAMSVSVSGSRRARRHAWGPSAREGGGSPVGSETGVRGRVFLG